jgi:hypothetical protein
MRFILPLMKTVWYSCRRFSFAAFSAAVCLRFRFATMVSGQTLTDNVKRLEQLMKYCAFSKGSLGEA